MAYDNSISTWIANYAYSAPNITVPLATFPEISADEAHTTTGSIGNFLFGFLHALYAKWLTVAVADRPTSWTCYKQDATDNTTGKVTTTFVLTFTTSLAVGSQTVDGET